MRKPLLPGGIIHRADFEPFRAERLVSTSLQLDLRQLANQITVEGLDSLRLGIIDTEHACRNHDGTNRKRHDAAFHVFVGKRFHAVEITVFNAQVFHLFPHIEGNGMAFTRELFSPRDLTTTDTNDRIEFTCLVVLDHGLLCQLLIAIVVDHLSRFDTSQSQHRFEWGSSTTKGTNLLPLELREIQQVRAAREHVDAVPVKRCNHTEVLDAFILVDFFLNPELIRIHQACIDFTIDTHLQVGNSTIGRNAFDVGTRRNRLEVATDNLVDTTIGTRGNLQVVFIRMSEGKHTDKGKKPDNLLNHDVLLELLAEFGPGIVLRRAGCGIALGGFGSSLLLKGSFNRLTRRTVHLVGWGSVHRLLRSCGLLDGHHIDDNHQKNDNHYDSTEGFAERFFAIQGFRIGFTDARGIKLFLFHGYSPRKKLGLRNRALYRSDTGTKRCHCRLEFGFGSFGSNLRNHLTDTILFSIVTQEFCQRTSTSSQFQVGFQIFSIGDIQLQFFRCNLDTLFGNTNTFLGFCLHAFMFGEVLVRELLLGFLDVFALGGKKTFKLGEIIELLVNFVGSFCCSTVTGSNRVVCSLLSEFVEIGIFCLDQVNLLLVLCTSQINDLIRAKLRHPNRIAELQKSTSSSSASQQTKGKNTRDNLPESETSDTDANSSDTKCQKLSIGSWFLLLGTDEVFHFPRQFRFCSLNQLTIVLFNLTFIGQNDFRGDHSPHLFSSLYHFWILHKVVFVRRKRTTSTYLFCKDIGDLSSNTEQN